MKRCLAVVALFTALLVVPRPATALQLDAQAGAAAERATAVKAATKVRTGRFKGRLYDAKPKKGTKISFKVKKSGKKFVAKKWSATVEMFCVDGAYYYEKSMGMTVPRVKLNRAGKGKRTWTRAHGVKGHIKLKVKGRKLTGTLEYRASNCDLYDNKLKMRRKG